MERESPKGLVADTDLLADMLDPAGALKWRGNSRAFVRLDTSLRAYWHSIFDPCPALLALDAPEGLAIFRPFMAWAAEQQLSMDWTLHLWIGSWLLGQDDFLAKTDKQLLRALRAAAAARWAIADRSAAAGIVLGQRDDDAWVVGWKSRRLEQGRQIELLEVDGVALPAGALWGWFSVPDFELDSFPGWQPLNR